MLERLEERTLLASISAIPDQTIGESSPLQVNVSATGTVPITYGLDSAPVAGYLTPSWWRAEGNAQDVVGTANGTLVNGTTFTAGKVGSQAFTFDGIDDYVDAGNPPGLNVTGIQLTVEAWVNVTGQNAANNYRAIVGKGDASSPFSLRVANDSTGGNGLFFEINTSSGYKQVGYNQPNSELTPGWHHVAGTYDGSTVKVYRNGMLIESKSHTGNLIVSSAPLTQRSPLSAASSRDTSTSSAFTRRR
jgi:hypothetical protein